MQQLRRLLVIIALLPLADCVGVAEDIAQKEQVTLLGMLFEWKYPDSKFNGATMSDAAVQGISAVKCKAVLTTSDSVDKVMDFYRTKLNVDADGVNLDEKPGERIVTKQSVLIQDVSGNGTSKLFVIAINEAELSTTLVVSRTDGDDTTRIAWSNYRQIWP